MSARPQLSMRRLTPGGLDVALAADCTSRSFSNDPLILWLKKPDTPPWGLLSPSHRTFQQLRLSRDAASNRVTCASLSNSNDVAGVCILHPPATDSWLSFWHWPSRLGSKWIDYWRPLKADDVDQARLDKLFALHHEQFQKHTHNLPNRRVWYLEVVATDPTAQGKGVGGALMRWAIEQIGNDACFLECTDERTVPFYKKYGFEVVGTSELRREVDALSVKLFWMLRASR